MHRVVVGLEHDDPREVDHIDRNPLNNRRANLRIVEHGQNRQNTKGWDNATSRHRGVSWDRARGKWLAQAKLNMRAVFIGRYDTEDEAAEAARVWRAEHMPYAMD
jgi:AP2-like factor (euAP2 lineage)